MTAALALDGPLTMTPPQSEDRQVLAALPSAIGCAERFVRFTLERWRLHDLIDTVEAAAAELVRDAVATTGLVIEHPSYLDLYDKQLSLLDLRLRLVGTYVLIELRDAGGKFARVELEIPAGSVVHAHELGLPRRAGFPRRPVPTAPAEPIEPLTDPALLRRVRDGLRQLDTNAGADTAEEDR